MNVARRAATRLKSLPEAQKEQMLALIGETHYDAIPRDVLLKKLGISAAVHASIIPIELGGIALATFAQDKLHIGGFGDITDMKTYLTLIASYVAHYGAIGLQTEAQHKLLKNAEVRNAPNTLSTALLFVANKFVPEIAVGSRKMRGSHAGIYVGTTGPILGQEVGALPAALFIPGAAEAVIARNVAGTALNLTKRVIYKRSARLQGFLAKGNDGEATSSKNS
jgi:hypothetical protein